MSTQQRLQCTTPNSSTPSVATIHLDMSNMSAYMSSPGAAAAQPTGAQSAYMASPGAAAQPTVARAPAQPTGAQSAYMAPPGGGYEDPNVPEPGHSTYE
uniref:Uncharacterized protein n=1 Tax=Globodera rostochiensis TaxID=31243 RepID=A0A914HSP6_GLORO